MAGSCRTRVATAIGLRDDLDRPVLEVLVDYLSLRRALLVLDNFEHVLDAADTVADLLSRASQLVVLVTSRAALHLPGETVYSVPPMATSGSSVGWPGAAELFRRRTLAEQAVTHHPTTSGVTPRSPSVSNWMASPWRSSLQPAAYGPSGSTSYPADSIADSTSSPARPTVVRRGIGRCVPRSRGASELLDATEQQVFRSLAVFRGGMVLEAAASVSGHGVDDTLDVLTSLVDKSLTSCESASGRFHMLETVREYAASQPEASAEASASLAKHADYFARLASAASEKLAGPAPVQTLDRLEAERDNLRAAILWVVSVRRPELGVGIAAPLWRYYHLRSHLSEGRQLLEDLLAIHADEQAHPWQASAALALGSIGYWQQDFDSSQRYYQTSADTFRALRDDAGLAHASTGLAYPLIRSGRFGEARQRLHEALQIFTRLSHGEGRAGAVYGLALTDLVDGQYDSASQWAELSLAEWSILSNTLAVINATCLLASIRRQQGSVEEAAELLQTAADTYLELGNLSGLHWILWEFAALQETTGDLEVAVLLASAADSIASQMDGGVLVELLRITPPYARAQALLGDDRVADLRAHGSRLNVREAIDLVRSNP